MNQRLTIAEAAVHPYRDYLTLDDLDVSDVMLEAAIAKFEWLRELDANSNPVLLEAAVSDVLGNVPLFLMLNSSACELYEGFKREDTSTYATSEVLGDDVNWRIEFLERAKVLVDLEEDGLSS